MKLLIVDDDFVSRNLLLTLLSSYAHCEVAVSAEEALIAYNDALADRCPYSGIYLDIHLPGENGLNMLKDIKRKVEKSGSPIPIVMVTSEEDPHVVMDAFRFQCDGYLIKPFDLKSVKEVSEKAGILLK